MEIFPIDRIEANIYLIRGCRVMLDRHLAALYGVDPRRLREQVRRNRRRFPEDFMFQLTEKEARMMVTQNASPSMKHFGGHLPYVFTQEGVAMLSAVLHSRRAIDVNIAVMRAFVRMRAVLSGSARLSSKLAALEKEIKARLDVHETAIVDVLQKLMVIINPPPEPPEPPKPRIGFDPADR